MPIHAQAGSLRALKGVHRWREAFHHHIRRQCKHNRRCGRISFRQRLSRFTAANQARGTERRSTVPRARPLFFWACLRCLADPFVAGVLRTSNDNYTKVRRAANICGVFWLVLVLLWAVFSSINCARPDDPLGFGADCDHGAHEQGNFRGNVQRIASSVMAMLLLVLLGAILVPTFKRTSSAASYLSVPQAWTLVGSILVVMGSCVVRIVCEVVMTIQGAKHVSKSAWLIGNTWIPEIFPLVFLVFLNWPSLQQSSLLNPVNPSDGLPEI